MKDVQLKQSLIKVLRVMIILVVIFLCGLYIIKIFFPEQFMITIQNANLVLIGEYIDAHWWLYELCAMCTQLLMYWLYLGALTKSWTLNWKELLAIGCVMGITHPIYYFDPALSSGLSLVAMLILPAIFKAKLIDVVTVFSVHYLAELISIRIRDLPMYLHSVNTITVLLMAIEGYFWLLLFYLYYNFKKEKNYGTNTTTTIRG